MLPTLRRSPSAGFGAGAGLGAGAGAGFGATAGAGCCGAAGAGAGVGAGAAQLAANTATTIRPNIHQVNNLLIFLISPLFDFTPTFAQSILNKSHLFLF